jgi:hypothetical protein
VPPHESHLNTVMFLCAERDDGTRYPIGTTFLVGLPAEGGEGYWPYFVTAWHVVQSGKPTWIRFRRWDGGPPEDWPVPGEWVPHPTSDIAVTPCDFDRSAYIAQFVPDEQFSDRWVHDAALAPGVPLFFIGLLAYVESMQEKNVPMVRTGGIGALFQTDIPMSDGLLYREEPRAHLIDCYSRGGFSGSPVFVDYPMIAHPPASRGPVISTWVALFGVLSGHFGAPGDNAGVAVVIPSEAIRELLTDNDDLRNWRERKEAEMREEREEQKRNDAASPDSVTPDPSEFDRFEDLTRKLVNTPQPAIGNESK